MLECVVNISEGRDDAVIDRIAATAGDALLDVHRDPDHHRSVLTLVGTEAPRAVTEAACSLLDLRRHQGVHPRFGVVDVVPFVPLRGAHPKDAVEAREAFMAWAASHLSLATGRYGPIGAPTGDGGGWGAWPAQRTLPELRRAAREGAGVDVGPAPTARHGVTAVGARPVMVAYNLWLETDSVDVARRVAAAVRGPGLRALGLQVGDRVQVSMNLVAPDDIGPDEAWRAVEGHTPVQGAELVGLLPAAVLDRTPRRRWSMLDLSPSRTIEARLPSG